MLNEVIKSVDYFKNRAMSTNSNLDTAKIKVSQDKQSKFAPKFILDKD